MARFSFIILMLLGLCCKNKKTTTPEAPESPVFSLDAFTEKFTAAALPYALSDSALLKNTDTTSIRNVAFLHLIPDSLTKKLFGKSGTVKYSPLTKVSAPKGETYFIVKAVSGNRRAALVTSFNKDKSFGAVLPFLIPDADASTAQLSVIDKNRSIVRSISQKNRDDVTVEGKEVYVYDAASNEFTLIMTDVLDESAVELINPIDTLTKYHKLAGDYGKDKKNMVSIRDAKNPNELSFYIHFDRNEGECTGELKGVALITSAKMAVYRQGGNPCVLEFYFTPSSVRLKEVQGCGSYRGVQCVIEGTFTRKKEAMPKAVSTKVKKK